MLNFELNFRNKNTLKNVYFKYMIYFAYLEIKYFP